MGERRGEEEYRGGLLSRLTPARGRGARQPMTCAELPIWWRVQVSTNFASAQHLGLVDAIMLRNLCSFLITQQRERDSQTMRERFKQLD